MPDLVLDYDCDTGRAQEIARLVLPLLTRLGIPMTPINYALWYEYHLGRSSELVEALAGIAKGRAAYDEETARALFLRYVIGESVETLQRAEGEIRRLLADIVQIISDSGLELTRYEALLGNCNKRLGNADNLHEIRELVNSLIDDTRRVSASSSGLAGALKDRTHEIDQLRNELERVRQVAEKDPLTGLANRRVFDRRLSEALGAGPPRIQNICLMMIDIDHFKGINDRHGHQIGDKVLQFVASVLEKNFKGRGMVARFGGDEFAVIVQDRPPAEIRRTAEIVCQEVGRRQLKRTDTGEPLGQLTVSIGYDCLRDGDSTVEALERADKALYLAKQDGRNRVKGYRG